MSLREELRKLISKNKKPRPWVAWRQNYPGPAYDAGRRAVVKELEKLLEEESESTEGTKKVSRSLSS